MPVKPRGDSFQATVHHEGQRIRKDFPTERAALIWESETKAALLKGETFTPIKGSVSTGAASTMRSLVDKATKMHWDRNKASYKSVQNAATFANWVGNTVSPQKALTQANVEKFVEYLISERKVSNTTINKYMSAISILARFAKLPAKLELPWFKPGKGRVRFFSDEEEALVLQTWRQWGMLDECDLFVCLLDTGARPWSEMTRCPWKDIETNRRKVSFWDTKNGVPRTLTLTTRALQAIQRQSRDNEGPFTHISEPHMNRLWDRTQAVLPQLDDCVIYTARHTCASRLVQRGQDLRRVKEWMGHKSITTTLIYAHLAPDNLNDCAEALERDNTNVTAPRFSGKLRKGAE